MDKEKKGIQFLNKRKFSRIGLIDPIRLITSEYTFEEYMGNLSKTGCMILSLKEFEVGMRIKLGIKSKEKDYVNFECVVKRCQEKNLEEVEAENKEIRDLLVVDDDKEINEIICSSLEDNFSVERCYNAEEARELIKDYNFRVILADARMPGEDGASLLEFIFKKQAECKRILITGQADNELLQRAINEGKVDKVFYKPIKSESLQSELKDYVGEAAAFKAAENTRQRYYSCYSCQYSAYRVDMVDGIKWQTQGAEGDENLFNYFYHKKFLAKNICPKCREQTFMSITSAVFEVGLEFISLNKELDNTINNIITEALATGSASDQRSEGRVEGSYIPIQMEKRFETGAELFEAYISDISRGGVRVELVDDYSIGQRINLELGVIGTETTQIPAKIMHKVKVSQGYSYGLKFEYFDVEEQAKLNHFIDDLALGEYRESQQKKRKKQLAVGVGGAGFSGFFAGVAATFLIFGGFYFLSGYQVSKKEKIISISEGKKEYKLKLDEVFEPEIQGVPKKLNNKIQAAKSQCQTEETVDLNCFKRKIAVFSKTIQVPIQNLAEFEQKILEKRQKISVNDLETYYAILRRKNLSEKEYTLKVEEFKLKVKRAIQLPGKK